MELVATKWIEQQSGIWIERTMFGDKAMFAIRRPGGECLNKQGFFECEPTSSNRDDSFLNRCRWNAFDEATAALEIFIALKNEN